MRTAGRARFAPLWGAVFSLGSGILLICLLILFTSADSLATLKVFFLGPWSSPWFIGNTLDMVALLMVSALGVAVAFRGGTFNLGGEGQIYLGGLGATVVLLSFPTLSGTLSLLLAALVSLVIGALMGGLSGVLKRYARADELITSFLFSAALTPVADYLIAGPLRDKSGSLLASPRFAPERTLTHLLPPSSLSTSFLWAIGLVFLVYILMNRTESGYRFRVAGTSPEFARYGGFPAPAYWVYAMAGSGALHGLAGFFAVAGTYGLCHQGFSGGLGWSGIAVALIGRNKPLALFPAALMFAWLKAGSDGALLASGLQFETSAFVQAIILLLVTVRRKP
ncbi:MAG TPA: ABC transporter permease [Treponema sp.]|jgi:simple sugar transport system permease protein|uniref:ABC transporter permease n=1 Tax=Gracilinema caldarium TaxID=215591 RepID=UPI0026EAE949|nr:ABC transporter permease [Gracilinema caldarium]HON14021.1 ABC transporter permease [Treponema sp.]HPC70756.1 ABC transporter permease [Treponema sp.]HRS04358.1 ABC transporter permease [Treponema sp.]HRU28882.1 ABC transporter permease [Treponema sp.]